jgi:small subunit ribosomal protein S9
VLDLTKKKDVVMETGKRKKAIARAIARPGKGIIMINNKSLEVYEPEELKLMIKEPLILSGKNDLDIDVSVSGGGVFGQATAARQAIARSIIEFDKTLKEKFASYDKTLLVADSRRTEPHKPSASKRGPRRHKQRSKR